MRIFLKCLLLFASIFVAAYVARILIVPDVVPIAEGEDPNWRIQLAFLLTSVQNVGLFGMAVVLIAAALSQIKRLGRAMSTH
jgi:hypothetical protein